MQINKGTILKIKNGDWKRKVLAVLDDTLYFLSDPNNFEKYHRVYMRSEIEELFDVVEEDWVPESGDMYWYVTFSEGRGIWQSCWDNGGVDNERLANKDVFRTKEEAEAAYKKWMEIRK